MPSALQRPGKLVAVGRNYLDHAKERGDVAPSDVPIIFLKPPSAFLRNGDAIILPRQSARVDYEGELVAILGRSCRDVDAETALGAVAGFVCGNDVTARDLQDSDKQWTRAKGFDTFAPLSDEVVEIDAADLAIETRVNGDVRQSGRTSSMIRPVGELIAFISSFMTLEPGDAVFTGTPAGVGPLADGDIVEVEIERVGLLRNHVRAQQ